MVFNFIVLLNHKVSRLLLFSFFLLTFFIPAYAAVFQWTDAEGKRYFSDKPHQGAKVFQLDKNFTYHKVKKVYDGDTVLLTNGKKIRFLGINTPEVEGRNKSEQAGGEEAKRWLIQRLRNRKVRLDVDVEKKDKYGRLLAHIFTEDKQHINLELVQQGLASVSIYPPNLKYTQQLLKAEQQAEQNQLGIWRYQQYVPKQVEEIKQGRFKGWQRVVGKVSDIHHTRKNSYLKLSNNFSIKINKKALIFFPELEKYEGKEIEVRGWINKYKGNYNLLVRHPSAIKIK